MLTVTLSGVVFVLSRVRNPAGLDARAASVNTMVGSQTGVATVDGASVAGSNLPDPRKLLEGVARARNRIVSGSIDYQIITEMNEQSGSGTRETNQFRARMLFDGGKRRIEQSGLNTRMSELAKRENGPRLFVGRLSR